MKLPVKLAGLLGSGVFILTALPGFFQRVKPSSLEAMTYGTISGMTILETLGISLAGAVVAGFIGYKIGEILSSPAGNHPRSRNNPQVNRSKDRSLRPVTGEETFLDDLEPAPAASDPANVMPIEVGSIDDA